MRDDTFMGLNDWASNHVNSSTVEYTDYVRRVYKDGSEETLTLKGKKCLVEREGSGDTVEGFNSYPLVKYSFPDGRVLFEYVQDSPWSSGPVIFLALKDSDGKSIPESLWTDEEINSYL